MTTARKVLVDLKVTPYYQKLLRSTKKVGSYFGGSDRLKEVASQRDRRFVKNVAGRHAELTAPHAG